MPSTNKLRAGAPFPNFTLPRVAGGQIKIGGPGWKVIVVYRGKHCPLCRKYLKTLNDLFDQFSESGIKVATISGDPQDKAESQAAEEGWRFPVGYGLSVAQMQTLGLYVSEPRSPQETDRPFPEPGLFVVNPDGLAQIIDVSNAPFSRPDLAGILAGVKLIREKNYPIRGTLEFSQERNHPIQGTVQ